ncbi:MAG: hypothetical protein V3T49_01320, partial [Dehalococcoidia bacterium]
MNPVAFRLDNLNLIRWLLLALLTMVLVLSVACGSSDDSTDSSSASESAGEVDDTVSEVSRIMMTDHTFTVDDYAAAGWK